LTKYLRGGRILLLFILGMKMIKMINKKESSKNQNPTRNNNLFTPGFIIYNPSVSNLPQEGTFILLAGGLFF
jgi:hypothetical protein